MNDLSQDNSSPPLSDLWQLPVVALSLILFGFGLYLAAPGDQSAKYAKALDEVAALNRAGRYERALQELEGMKPGIEKQGPSIRARHRVLSGDARHLGQRSGDWPEPMDHERVISDYQAARDLGRELEEPRVKRLAESLASAGQPREALELLDGLGEAGSAARQQLLKRLIRSAMRGPESGAAGALIDRLLEEPGLTLANEAWASARRAELMMRRGDSAGALELLLRRYARLQGASEEGEPEAALAEMMVMLGEAYLAEGDAKNAEQWFTRARQALEPGDPLNAEALVGLGKIRFGEDNPIEALEHFSAVVEQYAETPAYPEALIGKAESEARRGAMRQAMADYRTAVGLVQSDRTAGDALRDRLLESMRTQRGLRFGQGEYQLALDLLDLEERLHGEVPADLRLRRAVAHERLAQKLLGVEEDERESGRLPDLTELDASERREAVEHYVASAGAYRAHAEQVASEDNEAYGRSLWRAANHFDRAGRHERAIEVFTEYVEQRPNDPLRLEAMHRLGEAYQSAGRFGEAIEWYKRLVEEHPKSPEAYASLVPLARSYLAKGAEHTEQAEQVLRSVVNDHPALRPESRAYREALTELGQLYYRRGEEGDYERAIERLSEAVERWADEGEPGRRAELSFQLADAYRKSVEQIEKTLEGALPPQERAALEAERAERLKLARERFSGVIDVYGQRAPESLDDLERLYLRNSYFFRADCAYDLGDLEGPSGAIALYQEARKRYEKDPAVLVALVQIVNSYAKLGRWDEARRANERAKVYLKRIPDEAFEDPNMPMSREHWQRWLDWTSQLALKGGEGDPATPVGAEQGG